MSVSDKIISKELTVSENEVKLEAFKTELKKTQFIEEIRNGLGTEIKLNPRMVKVIKKPWHVKLKNFLGKLFTKF
jgi:hypothetical protein